MGCIDGRADAESLKNKQKNIEKQTGQEGQRLKDDGEKREIQLV